MFTRVMPRDHRHRKWQRTGTSMRDTLRGLRRCHLPAVC